MFYRLTPRGRELQPVIAALNVWGMRHAIRPALPGEAINPGRVVTSFIAYLNTTGVTAPEGTSWRLSLDGEPQDIRFERGSWRRRPAPEPALTVTTTLQDWSAMLSQSRDRPAPADVVEVSGGEAEAARFKAVLEGSSRAKRRLGCLAQCPCPCPAKSARFESKSA